MNSPTAGNCPYGMATEESMSSLIRCVAVCAKCNKSWSAANALVVGKKHSQKYDHKVSWEFSRKGVFSGEKMPDNTA